MESLLDYAEQRFSPRQLAGIAFVVLLHVAIIYALISGLGEQAVQVLRQPLEAKIIQQVKPPPPPAPPPPPPQLVQPPPPFIPPPLVQIAQPPPPPVIAAVTHVKPVAPPPKIVPPPPQPQPIRSAAGLDPNQSCSASATLQNDLGQEEDADPDMLAPGKTVLQFLIGADGHVVKAIIARSSGHDDLDEDAQNALAQCTFRPAIGADGKPQEAWTSIGYVWQTN